jgi:hypothetical protein
LILKSFLFPELESIQRFAHIRIVRPMIALTIQSLAWMGIVGLVVATTPGLAWAINPDTLPQNGNVVAGSASMDYNGNSLTVNQGTDRTVIDWGSFDIGANATTEFVQPSSSSLAVNRVVGGGTQPTQILGSLKSNGQIN